MQKKCEIGEVKAMPLAITTKLNTMNDRFEKIDREKSQRPILVKLSSGMRKAEIMENGNNIWIEEDFTKQIIDERKRLITLLK